MPIQLDKLSYYLALCVILIRGSVSLAVPGVYADDAVYVGAPSRKIKSRN